MDGRYHSWLRLPRDSTRTRLLSGEMGNCVSESLGLFPRGVLAQAEPSSSCWAQCMCAQTAAKPRVWYPSVLSLHSESPVCLTMCWCNLTGS